MIKKTVLFVAQLIGLAAICVIGYLALASACVLMHDVASCTRGLG